MVIRILDHVKHATDYADGDVIYRLVRKAFEQERKVTLSFDGILSTPSAFINAALVQLIEHYSLERIRADLTIIKSTRQINAVIKRRFTFISNEGEQFESKENAAP